MCGLESFTHPFIHSSIHPFIHSSIHPFIHSSIHPFIHSSIHPFIHSSIRPFIHSSIHPFIHSSIHYDPPRLGSRALCVDLNPLLLTTRKSVNINPFGYGRFSDPYFKVLWEGVKQSFLNFFFLGASAIKSFVRSRIFRYGLPKDISSKGQTKQGRGGVQSPPPKKKRHL